MKFEDKEKIIEVILNAVNRDGNFYSVAWEREPWAIDFDPSKKTTQKITVSFYGAIRDFTKP